MYVHTLISMDIIDDDMIEQLMKSPTAEEIDCGVAFDSAVAGSSASPP